MKPLRLAQIGTGEISKVHVSAYRAVGGVETVVCVGRDALRGADFARDFGFAEFAPFAAVNEVVARPDVDVVTIALPNALHAPVALAAIRAGKHVMVEKPLCLTLAEADEILHEAERAGVVVGYAEELCYVPKFRRMKQVADDGGLGRVYMVKQSEKHAGPYSPWFFDRAQAGGGIAMDMGCHAIEFCRWFMGRRPVAAVTAHMATYLHGAVTDMEDHVLIDLHFADGTLAHVESSWALKGGMESTAEAYGTEGVIYADLLRGMGMRAFSERGFAAETAGHKSFVGGPDARGWSFPDYDWLWNNGYPQEFADFFACVRGGGTPVASAADGRAVLELLWAAYASAGTGRTIALPYTPPADAAVPVDLWRRA